MLRKAYIFFYLQVLILASVVPAFSQNFPVSVNTTITPPYSTYLADYVAPGSQKLALNIFLNDINRPELQTRLRLRIEGQGILIETKPEFLPAPLILQGGIPERMISSDLAPYFLPQNLNFSGITRQQFERSGQLPEGLYSICIEVLEYNRGVKVSNSGCTMAWLILNDPPLINLPMQAEKLKPQEPQYVTFQWTPRHTGSPNSAFSTEYEFTLVELWPESRNPNDAILTSPPIYQTTTQSTTLIYGPAETPLVPGRRYAFRVKAKSISGIDELDLFKNQGYSQVHSFQYGDACDIPLNIKAKATNSGTFKVIYEPNTNHTAFSIRYRKANDPKATWYEVDSYFEEIEINGLQPETTYEYQLTAGCGPFGSEYSPVALVTTDAMPEVTYACGLPPEEFDFGNTEPLPALQRNDILYAGDFNVKISEATGSAGTFTGKGTVVVPYLDNLAVSVEFSNIRVNTEYRMTAGSMDVKGIGVDVLPDNFTDFLEELDETLASIDDVLGDVSAGLDIADEILGEVGDLANDILDNGPFDTDEEKALDGSSVEQYNEEAKKAINDAASLLGGAATVESIAEAAKKVAQGMALKNRANKLQNIYNNSDTLDVIAVEFYENLSGQAGAKYGFDQQAYAPHRLHYNIMVLPDNQSVAVPWAATKAGEAASIKAKWLAESNVPADSIVFKSGADGATLEASRSGNEWTITLPPITNDQSLVINAVDKKGETVGKLNAIGYEPIERKVHLISVGAESSISAAEVEAELNKIYAQAIASWKVEKHAAIQVEGYDNTLQDDKQALLSTYSDGMKAIIKAYQATEGVTINDNDFYLFLVGNSQTDKAGYMPRKHRFGFIYQNESSDIKRTIAHELGHGAFRLQHVHEEYPTIAVTTENLMDSKGTDTNLRKYQWDLIHNPPVVVGLVEDLEEGAYVSETKAQELSRIINYISCGITKGNSQINIHYGWEVYEIKLKTILQHLDFDENGNLASDKFKEATIKLSINAGTAPDPTKVFTGYRRAILSLGSYDYDALNQLKIPTDKGNFFFTVNNADQNVKTSVFNWLLKETGLDGQNRGSSFSLNSNVNYTADNILLFSYCQLENLTRDNRERLVTYLSNNLETLFGLENHDTYQFLLVNVLKTIPQTDRKYFYSLFESNPKWIRKIYYDISNDLKRDVVNIWFELWGEYYQANKNTISNSGKLFLKENIFGNSSNLAIIEESGKVFFIEPYQHQELVAFRLDHPFETVYLYKPEQNSEKPFVTLPAIAAILFLDQEHIKTWEDLGLTGINIALYTVGIGEVYNGIKGAALALETSGLVSRQFLINSARAFLGFSDIAAGISSDYCNSKNNEFCSWWNKYQFYINTGLLTASVADVLYQSLRNSYSVIKDDFTPDQIRYLEEDLGLVGEVSIFKVDKTLKSADELAGVLINGVYKLNPTATNVNSLIKNPSGTLKLDQSAGSVLNGQYMYVVDEADNIIIGTRAKGFDFSVPDGKAPHPTLIGGVDPSVKTAGIIEFRAGKIYKVDNVSGHFKPSGQSLQNAQPLFNQKFTPNNFATDFQGYIPFTN